MRRNERSSAFGAAVEKAALALKTRDFSLSRSIIADAMAMNMDAPEPHNLLGILYEFLGDDRAARQHYRVAYALDPTYKPSCRNLERLALYGWTAAANDIDFGLPVLQDQSKSAD